jgi:hypothetical protein
MNNRPSRWKARSSHTRNEEGITLVTTLLLLLLLVGMSLTMVLAVSSESLINGFYGRYRGSFYAADSGVAAGRQQLMNLLGANVAPGFDPATQPIPNGATAASNAANAFSTSYAAYTNVNSSGSWQERFLVKNVTVTFPAPPVGCSVRGGDPGATCANPLHTKAPITDYVYQFPYTMQIVGQSQGSEVATINDSGTITVDAPTSPPTYTQSFAGWGMFIGTYALCSADLVPGTITGPVFTNGSWNFSNSGPYSFTDSVGQVGATAGWDNGGCKASATPTNGIKPTFNGGFNVSQNAVQLPQNSFNQEQAVLDGVGIASCPTCQPQYSDLNAKLKNAAGQAYPTGGASTGVYVPYSVSGSPAVKTFTGGGIYVEGNAKVTLSPGANSTAQVFTIVQGSVTTTVTIDPSAGSAGTTTIVTNSGSGAGTQVINGVPQQLSSTGVSQGDATMLYVNGDITSLSGPGQGKAAINNGQAITVVASGNNDITVTGDILYKTEPVTMTGDLAHIDQLIPANDTGQVLGIFTSAGNVNLQNSQSNGNLEIDASIATISDKGTGGIVNTGNSINTLTIVGGRIQNTIQNIGATTRNVLFDRRFQNGFAPPWFPSTTITPAAGVGGAAVVTWKGTQWLNQTNYQ